MNEYINAKNKYILKRASKNDLEAIIDFQTSIIARMDRKDWFTPLTIEEFIDPIESNNGVYLVYNNSELIALAVFNAKPRKEIIDEYEIDNSSEVGIFDSIMVKEEYRGEGITKEILKFVYEEAKKNNIKYILATIHPENTYSLNNFLYDDYKILKDITIHNGIRHIMIKEVE